MVLCENQERKMTEYGMMTGTLWRLHLISAHILTVLSPFIFLLTLDLLKISHGFMAYLYKLLGLHSMIK